MARKQLIQIRRDTAANWASVNPVLASGEQGFETNTRLSKIGDGATAWNTLSYTSNLDKGSKFRDIRSYGAIVDGVKLTDASMTAGSAQMTSATAAFTSADVGKRVSIKRALSRDTRTTGAITSGSTTLAGTGFTRIDQGMPIKIAGAGVSGADLITTILTYVTSTQVIIATAASSTVSSASITFGAKTLNGTISAFTSSTSVTLSVSAAWTVSNATVFYGTDNSTAVQAATTAGGAIYFPDGITLMATSVVGTKSNLSFFGNGRGSSLLVCVGDSVELLKVDAAGKKLQNISFYDFEITCNESLESAAISLDAGNSGTSDTLNTVRINNVSAYDCHTLSSATVKFKSLANVDGRLSDIQISNSDFGLTTGYQLAFVGDYVTDVKIYNNNWHDSWTGNIKFEGSKTRSYADWDIYDNKFYRNSTARLPAYNIADANRIGMIRTRIHDNTFMEDTYQFKSQNFCIHIHSGWSLEIDDNIFWKVNGALAIGASNNGDSYQVDPDFMVSVRGNKFYQVRNIADHDASIFANWDGNWMVESGYFGLFSRHNPSVFKNNFIYNAPIEFEVFDFNDYAFSGAAFNTTGITMEGNVIMDDRLLADPTLVPVLAQVAGGALPARSYTVRYSYENDTGETNYSASTTLSVGANNLLRVTQPYNSTTGVPPGAKKINVYVGQDANPPTKQDYIAIPWNTESQEFAGDRTIVESGSPSWTEPTTGLVAGASLPTSNTTHPLTIFGFYEIVSTRQVALSKYINNEFYGVPVPIFARSGVKRISRGNLASGYLKNRISSTATISSGSSTLTAGGSVFSSGDVGKAIVVMNAGLNGAPLYTTIQSYTSATVVVLARNALSTISAKPIYFGDQQSLAPELTVKLESLPHNLGSVSGAVSFDPNLGEEQHITVTGNLTSTMIAGHYIGQRLYRKFTMAGSGGYTYTKHASEILAGGVFIPSATVGAVDTLIQEWDGTNWKEINRTMGLA